MTAQLAAFGRKQSVDLRLRVSLGEPISTPQWVWAKPATRRFLMHFTLKKIVLGEHSWELLQTNKTTFYP